MQNIFFDVGFQLSYIAILGIVYIQPKLYQLLIFRNYLLDKIWNMTTVSISAQFTTFPLSVYYFYQFPLLFLFTNLLVIPILSLTLPLGFIFMFFCLFNADFILHYLAMPIEWSILISNKIIVFFDKIPFSTLCPVYFTQLQLIFVYVIIGVFFIVLELKNSKWILVFQALLIGLFAYFIFEKINQSYQDTLVVFNIQNTQRIEFIQGNKSFIYTNKIDTAMYMFKIRPFHIFNRVNQLNYINSKEKNFEIHWKNNYIAIINNPIENNMNLKKYHYIIVGNNAL